MGWEGGSRTRGHGYTYGSFTLSYSRNQYNIVKQLSSNFKKRKKTTAAIYLEYDHLSSPAAAATAKSLQSCPTLCDPIDGSPPGSPVPGILQARTTTTIPTWESKGSRGQITIYKYTRTVTCKMENFAPMWVQLAKSKPIKWYVFNVHKKI